MTGELGGERPPEDPRSRHARVQEVFLAARRLSGEERRAHLDATCGDDAALRAELELLLAHDGPAAAAAPAEDSGLRRELEALHAQAAVPAGPPLPASIGEYRILRRLGEGGMGTVYEALQESLQRTVALKVLRPGMLSAQAERRFEHESEFLGRLEHPGIGRIYDSGRAQTAYGSQPYFAMELVVGEPLTAYADRRGLSVRERLELVASVADAVQHAHQQGVVHRDLKPDNILVDASGQPKVLDFGIARAVDGDVQRATLETNVGQILGTLAYMSPEQASGDPAAIDARSDVYALGVLLYELLAGRLPIDVSGRSLAEAVRVIREEEPRRLSTLHAGLRGDVETIARTALEKEKDRRYPTAAALAEDLRRCLRHEPIAARPASQLYVLGKFVRRNKAAVTGVVAVLLSLVAGLVASLRFGLREAQRTREVLQLSALQDVNALLARLDGPELWPVQPDRIPAYEAWLVEAEALLTTLPEDLARREELRRQAQAVPPPEPGESQEFDALRAKLAGLDGRLRFQRHLLATGASEDDPQGAGSLAEDPLLVQEEAQRRSHARVAQLQAAEPAEALGRPVEERLLEEAFERIFPGRTLFGEEPYGVALAERAWELCAERADHPLRAEVADTLAWGYFVLMRNAEARSALAEASAALPDARPARRQYLDVSTALLGQRIEDREGGGGWLEVIARNLQGNEAARAVVLEELERPRYEFGEDQGDLAWWYAELGSLVEGLESLRDEVESEDRITEDHGWGVRKRLKFARELEAGFAPGGAYARAWEWAYDRDPDLAIPVQMGLVPLGRDPVTGFWEFGHLASGRPAVRGPDERLVLDAETGVVLVLLPRGRFWMGAHADAEHAAAGAPNYDEGSGFYEWPLHEVGLSAFFLSKFELTQGQWLRLTGRDPSRASSASFLPNQGGGAPQRSVFPVTMVSWDECTRVCARFGLALPSEAQWEYAARGGTTTVWWTGDDPRELATAANLADEFARTHSGPPGWDYEPWSDGFVDYAPVDALRPNPFGFHNILGNVSEWCRDTHVGNLYLPAYSVDPVGVREQQILRMNRGGSLADRAKDARSSKRNPGTRGSFDFTLGLRPARPLELSAAATLGGVGAGASGE